MAALLAVAPSSCPAMDDMGVHAGEAVTFEDEVLLGGQQGDAEHSWGLLPGLAGSVPFFSSPSALPRGAPPSASLAVPSPLRAVFPQGVDGTGSGPLAFGGSGLPSQHQHQLGSTAQVAAGARFGTLTPEEQRQLVAAHQLPLHAGSGMAMQNGGGQGLGRERTQLLQQSIQGDPMLQRMYAAGAARNMQSGMAYAHPSMNEPTAHALHGVAQRQHPLGSGQHDGQITGPNASADMGGSQGTGAGLHPCMHLPHAAGTSGALVPVSDANHPHPPRQHSDMKPLQNPSRDLLYQHHPHASSSVKVTAPFGPNPPPLSSFRLGPLGPSPSEGIAAGGAPANMILLNDVHQSQTPVELHQPSIPSSDTLTANFAAVQQAAPLGTPPHQRAEAAGRRHHIEIKPREWAGHVVWAKLARYPWWPAQARRLP